MQNLIDTLKAQINDLSRELSYARQRSKDCDYWRQKCKELEDRLYKLMYSWESVGDNCFPQKKTNWPS